MRAGAGKPAVLPCPLRTRPEAPPGRSVVQREGLAGGRGGDRAPCRGTRPGQPAWGSARAAVEMLYGLQQRTRTGAATNLAPAAAGRLRTPRHQARRAWRTWTPMAAPAQAHPLLPPACRQGVPGSGDRDPQGRVGPGGVRAARPAHLHRDQPAWLRETAKRWAADDLPRRRGKIAAAPVRHYLTSLAVLSESLHGARPDHGEDPALLGRADIEAFVHRLTFLAGQGTDLRRCPYPDLP